jgi:histidine triad (HIT) family protein
MHLARAFKTCYNITMTNENCIFCKIVAEQIPSFKVYEDENHLGFLTIKPHTEGHMLLIPKNHFEDINEMDTESFAKLFNTCKILADKVKKMYSPKRVSLMTMGLEVNHTHLHILPINEAHDLDSSKAKDADFAKLKEIQESFLKY